MDKALYGSAIQHHLSPASAAIMPPAHRVDVTARYPAAFRHDASNFAADAFFFPAIHPSTAAVAFASGIENYLDPKYASDPAAFASRLPCLPFPGGGAGAGYGVYEYGFEPAFIRKRNERERQRVKCVNDGYARLREHLPDELAEKRLSKVETLRGAIQYIKHLQAALGMSPHNSKTKKPSNNKPATGKESAAAETSLKDAQCGEKPTTAARLKDDERRQLRGIGKEISSSLAELDARLRDDDFEDASRSQERATRADRQVRQQLASKRPAASSCDHRAQLRYELSECPPTPGDVLGSLLSGDQFDPSGSSFCFYRRPTAFGHNDRIDSRHPHGSGRHQLPLYPPSCFQHDNEGDSDGFKSNNASPSESSGVDLTP